VVPPLARRHPLFRPSRRPFRIRDYGGNDDGHGRRGALKTTVVRKTASVPFRVCVYRCHIRDPDRFFFPGFGSGRFSLRRLCSGYYDRASVKNSRESQRRSLPQIFTHCAHIFDESANANISYEESAKVQFLSYLKRLFTTHFGAAPIRQFHLGQHGSFWLQENL
jgi:hypothetical protein